MSETQPKTARELTDHKVNGLNEAIKISVLDEPGQGGACHEYEMRIGNSKVVRKPTIDELEKQLAEGERKSGKTQIHIQPDGSLTTDLVCRLSFQNGPVKEAGFNGFSQESLLAIVIDRLKSFQAGPYSTKENACALTHLQEAMHWLHARTHDRLRRDVEGTNQK